MTPGRMAAVRGELEAFAAEVFEPFARDDQRRWGQVCLRGLLTDGKRKSVEPMATRLGEDGNRQALAHFITTSPWDPAHVRARLAWRMEAGRPHRAEVRVHSLATVENVAGAVTTGLLKRPTVAAKP